MTFSVLCAPLISLFTMQHHGTDYAYMYAVVLGTHLHKGAGWAGWFVRECLQGIDWLGSERL